MECKEQGIQTEKQQRVKPVQVQSNEAVMTGPKKAQKLMFKVKRNPTGEVSGIEMSLR